MLHVLVLKNVPILDQLLLEEALLRQDLRNFCIINSGVPAACVLGLSAKLEQVICLKTHEINPIPIIRRYSGGGTVIIEPTTFLVSWILNHTFIEQNVSPQDVMKWSSQLLPNLFPNAPITLKENDYVIGNKKCGGNAQYFTKSRFVHHSSFIWDYKENYMNYLKMPPKMPAYRQCRTHDQFLIPLKNYIVSLKKMEEEFLLGIEKQFSPIKVLLDEVIGLKSLSHRKSTTSIR